MAGISSSRRASLPRGSYVYGPSSTVGGKGKKSFPIDTKPRARNALARAAQSNNAATYGKVEKAVNRKWPDIQTKHHTPQGK